MKAEEFKAKTAELLENLSDQAKASTILSELTEAYSVKTAESITAAQTAEKMAADNENLRAANMKLFLKVGETKEPDTKTAPQDTTPKYEDLFDANGNLK